MTTVFAVATAAILVSVGQAQAQVTPLTAIGTWDYTVFHPQPPVDHPSHRGTISFHLGGTLVETNPHGILSLGRWEPTGLNTFRFMLHELYYDSNHAVVKIIEPVCHVTIAAGGNSYTARCNTGVLTPEGTIITVVKDSTEEATRVPFPTDF